MGSPLGPILANIFVGAMEKQLFQANAKPLIYVRYMDDICAVFNSEAERDLFQQLLNNMHRSLQFTVEYEVNGTLPFLDVMIERTPSKFITSVYRKPTFTGHYIRWSSFVVKRRKLNLIRCLVHRAVKLCSEERLESELNKIRAILASNGYPHNIVEPTIQQKLQHSQTPTEPSTISTVTLRLPYIGKVSTKYIKATQDAVSSCYPDVKVRAVLASRRILPPSRKDVLPIHMNSNIIYKFVCHCDKWYIGSTSRRLKTRLSEHVPKCVKTALSNPNEGPNANPKLQLARQRAAKKSSVAEHLMNNTECLKHYQDDRFTILARGRNDYHLIVLESMYIMSLEPALCKMQQFDYKLKLF